MTQVVQSPAPVSAAEAHVACAIYCCDKKEYSLLKKPKSNEKTCQRLGHRKHSCVLHALRETDSSGRMTTKNKFPGVEASPRIPGGDRPAVPGVSRTLIPDTIVDGNKVIDAKFPCETKAVHGPGDTPPGTGPGFTNGKAKQAYPSDSRLGSVMATGKEKDDYQQIEGPAGRVKKVECMTPKDAESKKGDCKCSS